MKWIKRILVGLVAVIGLAVIVLWATGNGHILRGIPKTYLRGVTSPDIDDMDLHPVRVVRRGTPEPWPESAALGSFALSQEARQGLVQWDTEAFLVWSGDSLIYEEYWNDSDQNTRFNSFSMAKSFTSLAVGCAWKEGKIFSLQDPLANTVAGYNQGLDAKLQIEHLLQMASGINFGESYGSPFGYMAKAYYGTELEAETRTYHASLPPGTQWKYEGGNTVLLGMAVTEATGKPLGSYFSEKIWSRIGAEHDAYWNLDVEDGLEKAFSAFYATPRDFGRIGKLMLDSGRWAGEEVVPWTYLEKAFAPVNVPGVDGQNVDHYGYQFWLNTWNGHKVVACNGMRGQHILTVPDRDLLVVRIGHQRPEALEHGQSRYIQDLLDYGGALQDAYAQRH